jgi:hypothetical protein
MEAFVILFGMFVLGIVVFMRHVFYSWHMDILEMRFRNNHGRFPLNEDELWAQKPIPGSKYEPYGRHKK